jgi:sulfoxide reductase heme-binding subunit YedZ
VLVLGIATVNRWRPGGTPAFVTAAVHRSISLLSVLFIGLHVATALVDPYASVNAVAVLVPFVGSGKPLWVGLGALSVDLVVALILSSLLRRRLSLRTWRAVHWLAYLCWPAALAHGLGLGSDAGKAWLQALSALCIGSVALALAWRVRARRPGKRLEPSPVPRSIAARARAEASA